MTVKTMQYIILQEEIKHLRKVIKHFNEKLIVAFEKLDIEKEKMRQHIENLNKIGVN